MTRTLNLSVEPARLDELNRTNAEAMDALAHYLQDSNTIGIWGSGENHVYTYKQVNYSFNFKQSIVRRNRKEGREGYRFEIYNPQQPLGKGGYGIVYPISATVKFEAGIPVVKKSKNRLVKVQTHKKQELISSVMKEYMGLLRAGHLHVKPPLFIKYPVENKSYLVMEKVEGFTLEQILNPDKRRKIINYVRELTLEKRIELTFAILKAIKTQVTDRQLIHRDIKPGNFVVDLGQSPPVVKVIDYGFVLQPDEQDNRQVGTRAYRAPESFAYRPNYTNKADIYSAGRVLSYLWGDNYNNYYISRDKNYDYIKTKSTNKDLFCLPEIEFFLTKEDQNKIRAIIAGMIRENPDHRLTIDEAINHFSRMNFQKYQINPSSHHHDLNEFKLKLKRQLPEIHEQLKLLQEQEVILRNKGHSTAADTMQRLVYKLTANTNFLEHHQEPSILMKYRICCLDEINLSRNELRIHRDSWWLVAEVASAIGLLGIGYFILFGINYYNTGRLGLFSQTKSDQMVDQVKESILGGAFQVG